MSLLVLMFPITVVTVLVVIVLAIIATFHKEGQHKFTGGGVVLAGAHFLALMAVALSVTQIGFAGIEKLVPDALTDSPWRLRESIETARYALAVLFIVTPLYLVMVWKGGRLASQGVSWSKRFMSATVLLVAGLVVLSTLVTLVYNFLSGELGLRLLTKIMFLLVIAGGAGAYYQIFLKKSGAKIVTVTKLFMVAVGLLAITMVVWGFVVTGGPAGARAERFDDKRLSDLSTIQWQVDSYFQEYGRLPGALVDLHDASRGFALPVDPRTDEPYGYKPGDLTTETLESGETRAVATFELCATFETERELTDNSGAYQPRDVMMSEQSFLPGYYEGDDSPFWNHPAGEHCFERTVKDNNFGETVKMINQ